MSTLTRKVVIATLAGVLATSAAAAGEFVPPSFTEAELREIHYFALGIYFEARGEPIKGQLRVAESIINRVKDPRWPKTFEAVIRQGEEKRNGCQYSFMCDGQPEHVKERRAWALSYDLARDYYMQLRSGGMDVSSCAHSYIANYATNTAWHYTLWREGQVGTHIFYCDDKTPADARIHIALPSFSRTRR